MKTIHYRLYLKVMEKRFEFLAALLIATYVTASVTKMNLPGPQYDELSFTNTALGFKYESFASVRLFGLPVLILPYVTALKSYLFFPVFKIMDVSYLSIRLPLVFLAVIGLWFFFKAISNLSSKKIALFSLLILVLDSTFIGLVKLDVGINAIEIFCKFTSILFLSLFLRQKKMRYFYGLIFIISLGVISKLNFVWFLNSLTVAMLVYRKDVANTLDKLNKRRHAVIAAFSLYLFCYGLYFFLSVKYGLRGSIGIRAIQDNISLFRLYLPSTLNGQAFNTYITGGERYKFSGWFSVYIGTLLLLGLIALLKARGQVKTSILKLYAFSSIMVITTLAQILITADANAPWHYFAIYPFITILIALSVYFISLYLKKLYGLLFARITTACLFALIIVYQIFSYSSYISALNKGTLNWYWSDAIYSLIDYTKTKNEKFVVVDWGIQTQLFSYDYREGKYSEAWGQLYSGPTTSAFEQDFKHKFLLEPNTYFITFNPLRPPQKQKIKLDPYYTTNNRFFQIIENLNYESKAVQTIYDRQGQAVYYIYQLSPK